MEPGPQYENLGLQYIGAPLMFHKARWRCLLLFPAKEFRATPQDSYLNFMKQDDLDLDMKISQNDVTLFNRSNSILYSKVVHVVVVDIVDDVRG